MKKPIIMIVSGVVLVLAADTNKVLLQMTLPFIVKALSTGFLLGLMAWIFHQLSLIDD